jgi:hypothetical protein
MKRFIYNEWKKEAIDSLNGEIASAFSCHRDFTEDMVDDFIAQEIDDAVIYYSDAWAIAYELADSDWAHLGEITNINQLAYVALFDKVHSDSDMEAATLLGYLEEISEEE